MEQKQHLNVFDIQKGSFHDGPGIRTVVFLKGCNMRCFWCQNPESLSAKPQVMFYAEKCIGCGKCVGACPNHCHNFADGTKSFKRDECDSLARCVEACDAQALKLSGKQMSVEDIMQTLMQDYEMYQISGGGLTISGGEPLLQAQGCASLLECAKERGINTAIETCGNVPFKNFDAVLPFLDLIFFDLKILDKTLHAQHCGCSNDLILKNIKRLASCGVQMTVRTPIIPGINDNEEFVHNVSSMLSTYGIKEYELLAFHKLGRSKYRALDMEYQADNLKTPLPEQMNQLRGIVKSHGLTTNCS